MVRPRAHLRDPDAIGGGLMSKSPYGEWESRGEVADGAAWTVANVHHIHSTPRNGYACLCGAKTITARQSTEHIMDVLMTRLADAGVPLESEAAGREAVEGSGVTR